MPWKNENDLRGRLAAILPMAHSSCPDPQCGPNWTHHCQLGDATPDMKLANLIATEVEIWLRVEANNWRQAAEVIKDLEPSSPPILSLRTGADALTALALTIERCGEH